MATAKTTKPKKPTGRPVNPNKDQIIQDVLHCMAVLGMSAFRSCKAAGIPHSTFLRWVDEDATLADKYARAREDLIEHIAAETLAIADQPVGSTDNGGTDSGAVQDKRLRVDTRKWLLSKLAPKKYGDKLELTGDPDRPLAIQKIERVVVK